MNNETPAEPQQQGWADRTFEGGKKTLFGCLAVLGLLVAVPVFLFAQGGSEEEPMTVEEPSTANPLVHAYDDDRVAAQLNLKAMLKDADSAELRGEFMAILDGGNPMLCGEVNSRNSFGALTGFKRFIASPNPAAPSVIEGETLDGTAFDQAYSIACASVARRF